MPEYTLLVIFAVLMTLLLDLVILKTKLLTQKRFWVFYIIVILLQTIVDNYLNGRWWHNTPIVGPYPTQFYSGIKVWHTPLENYFYGFALVTSNVILIEWLSRRRTRMKAKIQ